jgi:Na+/H+-translocating membrane pyrophosphatase
MNWLRSTIGMIVTGLGLLLIVVAFLYLQSCSQNRQRAAQSKVDRGQSGAFQNSAADAVNTVGGVAANQMAGEDLTRRNEKEIRDAPGANDPINPALRDAAVRSLCRRTASRNDPRCRVQSAPAR